MATADPQELRVLGRWRAVFENVLDVITELHREGRILATNSFPGRDLDKVQVLSGLLPICASCKNIRDDRGYRRRIEGYISEHSNAEFSHGLCPPCASDLRPARRASAGRREVAFLNRCPN